MNVVGSLKINKWHIVSYIHYGSLHIKPSPMVEFNGNFNVIEKSEECSVLGLPYERQFHGSLRLRMAKQTTFFKENKTPDILTGIQGAGSHRCVQCAITPWVADDIICGPGPCTPAREALEYPLLIKNQHLDFVSYSVCMQYLEGVSGE